MNKIIYILIFWALMLMATIVFILMDYNE